MVLQVVPPGELQAGPSKPGSVRASGHVNPSPTVEAEHTILPGHAIPNVPPLYVFSLFVSLFLLPAGQTVQAQPGGSPNLTRAGLLGEG